MNNIYTTDVATLNHKIAEMLNLNFSFDVVKFEEIKDKASESSPSTLASVSAMSIEGLMDKCRALSIDLGNVSFETVYAKDLDKLPSVKKNRPKF
jgi:hypothetical protein